MNQHDVPDHVKAIANRPAPYEKLTDDQIIAAIPEDAREAIYRWLESEADFSDFLPSALWERAWLPGPGTNRR